jgi:type II secretory pathway pseudopilin PulG
MILNRDRVTGGYVLIEVVVSLVVFSIGAISVMKSFSAGTFSRGLSQDYTIAGFLCQKAMTESRTADASQEGPQHGDFGDEYPRFHWTRTLEIVMVELPPPPKQQVRAQPSGLPWKRSPLSERLRGQPKKVKEQEQEPIPFLKTTVVVSWTRRGAGYSVSAETMVPVDAEPIKTGGRGAGVYP